MAKSDAKAVTHICRDGRKRVLYPVYFREINSQTGKRHFVRQAWFCYHCGYGNGCSFKQKENGAAQTE